jgi:hypothetical protein
VVAVLAVPASASAAEIGSDLQGAQVQISCGTGNACILTQDTIGGDSSVNVAPAAGRLTSFRVKGAVGSFRFVVLRVSGGSLSVAHQTPELTGEGAGSDESYTFTSPLAVQAGDFIGIQISATGEVGARDATADGDTNLAQFSADGTLTREPDGPFELFLSATFVANTAATPPVTRTPATTRPDPLAALRAGRRPKVTVGGGAVTVSRKGVALIALTNPNGYAVKGSLSLAAGKLKLGKGKVSLAARANGRVRVKLSKKALRRLRTRRRLRATATAKVTGPVGKAGVTRKKLTLKAPARKRKRRAAPPSGGGGGQTPAAGNRWVARKGTSGAYDDFRFTLGAGNITLTQPTLLFVSCFEMGGAFRSSSSFESFNLLGPWALGNQSTTRQQRSRAVNQLVSSGERTITYKMTSTRSGDRITGKLTMSFSDSKYNPFTNAITFINCSGTQSYEAIPG